MSNGSEERGTPRSRALRGEREGYGESAGDGEMAERALSEATDRALASALDSLGAELREVAAAEDAEERLFARAEAMGLVARELRLAPAARPSLWEQLAGGFGWRAGLAMAGAAAAIVAAVAVWNVASTDDGALPQLTLSRVEHAAAAPTSAMRKTAPSVAIAARTAPGRAVIARRATAPDEVPSLTPTASSAPDDAVADMRYSEFLPVGTAPALRPDEFVRAVRVRIDANDFWRLGVPVAPTLRDDRVTADFLVGEDGRARAVRLVSTNEPMSSNE